MHKYFCMARLLMGDANEPGFDTSALGGSVQILCRLKGDPIFHHGIDADRVRILKAGKDLIDII